MALPDYSQIAANGIQGAQAAGYFNPQGSAAINAGVRREALRSGDNLRRRNAILARLMGLDPNQARVASVNADATASGNTADALNQSYLGQQLGNRDYFRGLYGGQLGNENQRGLLQYQHDLSDPGIGTYIGQAAGQILPKLLLG